MLLLCRWQDTLQPARDADDSQTEIDESQINESQVEADESSSEASERTSGSTYQVQISFHSYVVCCLLCTCSPSVITYCWPLLLPTLFGAVDLSSALFVSQSLELVSRPEY